jgi:hypothetical protein
LLASRAAADREIAVAAFAVVGTVGVLTAKSVEVVVHGLDAGLGKRQGCFLFGSEFKVEKAGGYPSCPASTRAGEGNSPEGKGDSHCDSARDSVENTVRCSIL